MRLGVIPFERFVPYYKRWGCSITEQVISLTNEEKHSLKKALADNLRQENKVYRYNFFMTTVLQGLETLSRVT